MLRCNMIFILLKVFTAQANPMYHFCLFQDYFFVVFDVNPETDNVVSAIYHTMTRVYIPALKVCKGWGDINPPNPNSATIIKTYESKIMLFVDYLASECSLVFKYVYQLILQFCLLLYCCISNSFIILFIFCYIVRFWKLWYDSYLGLG